MRQKKTLSDEKQKYLKSVIKKRNNMTWVVNVGSGLKLTSFGHFRPKLFRCRKYAKWNANKI